MTVSVSRESASRFLFLGFLFYVLILLGLQIGHLYWLLIIYGRLRTEYGLDPDIALHSWGFAGAGILLLMMVAGPFCVVSLVRRYSDVDVSWMGARRWIMFFWPVSLALYNGQVIHFLVDTTNLYVSLVWSRSQAECACHQESDPLLNISGSIAPPLSHCQCLTPADPCPYQISATDPHLISADDLTSRGASYQGDVTSFALGTHANVTDWLDEQDHQHNIQYMLVLAKACALVTVLHFPLWLLDHYLIRMASDIEGATDTRTVSKHPAEPEAKAKQSWLTEFLTVINELLGNTVYCFAENIDGFSLLDEYLELTAYLVNKDALRMSVLAFLGSNIILVSGYNGVKHLLKGYALTGIILKCLIVLLNNLPFMVIRIYMLWVVGGSRILDLGITTFFYFVCKEAVFLVMYLVECVAALSDYCTREGVELTVQLDLAGLDPREHRRKVDFASQDTVEHYSDEVGDEIPSELQRKHTGRRRSRKQKLTRQQSYELDSDEDYVRNTSQRKSRSSRVVLNSEMGDADDNLSEPDASTEEKQPQKKKRKRKKKKFEDSTEYQYNGGHEDNLEDTNGRI